MDAIFTDESRRRADESSARQQSVCQAKRRYDTREDAEEAAHACTTSGRRTLRVYRCDYCDGWHLTSKPER